MCGAVDGGAHTARALHVLAAPSERKSHADTLNTAQHYMNPSSASAFWAKRDGNIKSNDRLYCFVCHSLLPNQRHKAKEQTECMNRADQCDFFFAFCCGFFRSFIAGFAFHLSRWKHGQLFRFDVKWNANNNNEKCISSFARSLGGDFRLVAHFMRDN